MKLSPFSSDSIIPIISIKHMRNIYYGHTERNWFDNFGYCHFIITKRLFIEIHNFVGQYATIFIHYDKSIWYMCRRNQLAKKFSASSFGSPLQKNKYDKLSLKICDIIFNANFSAIYKNKLYRDCINYKLLIQNLVNFF